MGIKNILNNYMKSIIIFGKGKSLLRCTKKITDSFDKVAIINYPKFVEKHMSNRADYHFTLVYGKEICDWDDKQMYRDYAQNKLGIEKIFNIGNQIKDHYKRYYHEDIYKVSIPIDYKFRQNYGKYFDWFPPSGILAFDYLLKTKKYKKICLVGFDFFSFNKECTNDNYYNNKMKGIMTHFPKKQVKYLIKKIKENKNINFILYTNYKEFPKLPNLEIR